MLAGEFLGLSMDNNLCLNSPVGESSHRNGLVVAFQVVGLK